MIDDLVTGLRANACSVTGPITVDEARAAIVARAGGHELVACNADVPVPGIIEALGAAGVELLLPGDPAWSARLPGAAVGITGSLVASARPAAIALVAAQGSPRGTSLVPASHICVVRVADIRATLAAAMIEIAAGELPSALTWIGGPSRTGDLEMVTTLGVHGPRAVEVMLLE